MLKVARLLRSVDGAIKWLALTGLFDFILWAALILFQAPRDPGPARGETYRRIIRGYATAYVTKTVTPSMIDWLLLMIGMALPRSVLRGFVPA